MKLSEVVHDVKDDPIQGFYLLMVFLIMDMACFLVLASALETILADTSILADYFQYIHALSILLTIFLFSRVKRKEEFSNACSNP